MNYFGDPGYGSDYIGAPMSHEWGTKAWIWEAMDRYDRALHEFVEAAHGLAACVGEVHEVLGARQRVIEKADGLARAKWLQRESAIMATKAAELGAYADGEPSVDFVIKVQDLKLEIKP